MASFPAFSNAILINQHFLSIPNSRRQAVAASWVGSLMFERASLDLPNSEKPSHRRRWGVRPWALFHTQGFPQVDLGIDLCCRGPR